MELLIYRLLERISQDWLRHAAVTKNPRLSMAYSSNSSFLQSLCILSPVSRGSGPCCPRSRPRLMMWQKEKVCSVCGEINKVRNYDVTPPLRNGVLTVQNWRFLNHREIIMSCKKETRFAEIPLQTRICNQIAMKYEAANCLPL